MKKTVFLLIILVLAMAFPAWTEATLDIKLDFFGPAAGEKGGPAVATTFYLKSMVQRNLQVKFAPEALLVELRKTFNASDVSLLASGDLHWSSAGDPLVMQVVQIDGRDYAIGLTPLPRPGAVNFKVGVVEKSNGNKIKDVLLDTEIVLPDGEVAMLGFRDSQDRSYFIAFYVQGRNEKFGKDVVRLARGTKPKQVKHVDPVYPKEAVRNRVEGVVVLEAIIDEKGKVTDARVTSAANPLLDMAALQALKQWEYEPYIVNGKAKEVLFTVTVNFALSPEAEAKKKGDDALTRLKDSERPHKVKDVRPIYPEEAAKSKIEGVVVLEAVADEKGKVRDLRVISSPSPLLAMASMEAVKQWEYEPYIVGGKAQKIVFTVTMTFALKKEKD